MIEIFTTTVRKKSKANTIAMILAFSLVCFVVFFVNLFIGAKSPMKQVTWPSFLLGIVFFIWWLVQYKKMKLKMYITMDKEKKFFISIPLKDGTEIKLDRISAIEPFYGRVFYGKGPKVKELYLKIFDEHGNNALTLFHTLGVVHPDPEAFQEMEESDLLRCDKGTVVYYCLKCEDVYYRLTDFKNMEVRRPQY
jgi:energy-coupling factor transporter transmembrane protein EcfT